MTMTEFIAFLRKHCKERIKTGPSTSLAERDQSHAYEDVAGFIDSFLKEYAKQKNLTKQANGATMEAILNDERRKFDDPIELINHIHEIARRPPFFDEPRISLLSISSFCSDFLHRHSTEERKELLKHVPF